MPTTIDPTKLSALKAYIPDTEAWQKWNSKPGRAQGTEGRSHRYSSKRSTTA